MTITNYLIAVILIISNSFLTAQVACNTDNSDPHSSAMLDVKSAEKGFLLPRMTEAQRDSISSPAAGLMLWCIDCGTDGEMQVFNGYEWTNILGKATKNSWQCGDSLYYVGQDYATIQIGDQCWMAENLNIGTKINIGTTPLDNNIIEKYCYSNLTVHCNTYGGLYTWYEMMQYVSTEAAQGICPTGWHLPSDDEWKTLEMELGMSQSEADDDGNRGTNEGSKMAGNDELWDNGALINDPEFSTSGFEVLPAGSCLNNSSGKGDYAYHWSSTWSSSQAWYRQIRYDQTTVGRADASPYYGFSVRCVKD